MEVLRSLDDLKQWIDGAGSVPRTLVPTMGALHRGHTSLFDLARCKKPDSDVVATIFVNPTQFGPDEDFGAYPRQLESDLQLCEKHRVEAVFVPEKEDMYREDSSISITESKLSNLLCGASRPGHFDGVCTVVAKLFLITQPDAAVFGEKDFQQLAVIRRMIRDLNFPIEVIAAPTVREEDGLAMSSRNAYLTSDQRRTAPVIYDTLTQISNGIAAGAISTPEIARKQAHRTIESCEGARLDYFEIVDSESLEPLDAFGTETPRLLAAVFFGKTRLIDNVGLPALSE
ncbi:MAG: pantoate--beta-alanine ligase [Verrucomicrobiota bacterium]